MGIDCINPMIEAISPAMPDGGFVDASDKSLMI
jgi:hypothetical protein